MGASTAPGPQEKRLAAYMDGLAKAAGHADREQPLKAYCAGLLLPGERKSVEPMAAGVAPADTQQLHHFVSASPWPTAPLEEELVQAADRLVGGPDAVLVIDDTARVKQGRHSVGVKRQYSGTLGRVENCQIGVFLGYHATKGHTLVDRRLFVPAEWANDRPRRQAAGVPEGVIFRTKPELALAMVADAVASGLP